MNRRRRLLHLSDLHVGGASHETCERLARAVSRLDPDHVVVTGDLTHRGQNEELDHFLACFEPFVASGRMTLVPGNHDRLGDDLRDRIMPGPRVSVEARDGLHLVRVDSTGLHNRRIYAGHGVLYPADLEAIADALIEAPDTALRVVAMHHHPLPLPPELTSERLSSWLWLPYAAELAQGPELLQRIWTRCDLVVHGHRHAPALHRWSAGGRAPFHVCNAGSSSLLGLAPVVLHESGHLRGAPAFVELPGMEPGPRTRSGVVAHPTPAVQPTTDLA